MAQPGAKTILDPHAMQDNYDPDLNQETLTQIVATRTRRQAAVLAVLCLIEGGGAVVWMLDGASQPLFEDRLYFVWGAVLGLISATLGIFGAYVRSRTALIIFFINQLWGLALVSTRLLDELREVRLESEYCDNLPPDYPPEETDLDCADVPGRLARNLASGIGGMLAMWMAAFVSFRLLENMQDRDVSDEDARLVELILRVKAEMQESATEFEEFICKRLDDVEEVVLPNALPQPRPGERGR
mmetsp:Transcript_21068/g.62286  ORF Transcript_21068/g.62286 Transcript_21068/m.62286 type:complete len:243 (+) Transcript_21068:146-874(+)